MASTSKVTENAFKNDGNESTDKDTDKQTTNNTKKKKGIGLTTGWLRMVEPRKVPYFPQIKDKIVYLRQAHECYLKEVAERKIYEVEESDKLWILMNVDVFEYLTVVDISFEKYPTRVACLTVKRINKEEKEIGPALKLRYHDMGDVVDFLVLKHIFEEGLKMKWNVGDRFRCLVGDKWFFGTIKSKQPYEEKYPKSPFKSFRIKWDDEKEIDELSPWELESINKIDKSRLPKNHGEYVKVLQIEIKRMRYNTCSDDDWKELKTPLKDVISEIDHLMSQPITKCFIEIKNDPIYDALVPYPIDLSTMKERIEKNFYRRIDALKTDIFYLENNAKKYKSRKFYEEATLITQVCKDVCYENSSSVTKNENLKNLNTFFGDFDCSVSNDSDNEYKPSKKKKRRLSNCKTNRMTECKQLLDTLWDSEDMFPFRQPVCREDYPDYYKMIKSPICLSEINEKFKTKIYNSPKELFDDIKLLITNSRTYNKDEEKAIYQSTKKVSDLFEELKKQINRKIESPRKKFKKINDKKKNESDEFTPPSRRRSVKINGEKVSQEEKETKVFTQEKNATDRENGVDGTILDQKHVDSKNNNHKKDLSEILSAEDNNTNLEIESSSFKTNVDVSPMEITKNLPQETPNLNKNVRMKDNADPSNTECDNRVSENTENNSRNQFNEKSEKFQNSQRRISTDSVIVIDSDSDDTEEQQNGASTNFQKLDDFNHTEVDTTAAENCNKEIIRTSQKRTNNRTFQLRFCKSCATCKSIKQIYLDHIKKHRLKK